MHGCDEDGFGVRGGHWGKMIRECWEAGSYMLIWESRFRGKGLSESSDTPG